MSVSRSFEETSDQIIDLERGSRSRARSRSTDFKASIHEGIKGPEEAPTGGTKNFSQSLSSEDIFKNPNLVTEPSKSTLKSVISAIIYEGMNSCQGPIPTIVITNPEGTLLKDTNVLTFPQTGFPDNDSFSYKEKPHSNDDQNPNFLCLPIRNVTREIPRPPNGERLDLDSSFDMAEGEKDFLCPGHHASTPLTAKGKEEAGFDSDCSMVSLNDASPITTAESSIETPNISCNHALPQDNLMKNAALSDHDIHQACLKSSEFLCLDNSSVLAQPGNGETEGMSTHHNLQLLGKGYICDEKNNESSSCSSSNTYVTCTQDLACSDYLPSQDNSWTDLSYRCSEPSLNPSLTPNFCDPCCFSGPNCAYSYDTEHFVYPSIYVSSAGLISVLLRNDMSVEMTVDRTIRVVSHNHMMAVATDSKGTAACIYHPAVKVFQTDITTDIATQNFRAQMGGNDSILFSNGTNYFKLQDSELQPIAPLKFTDIFRDQSVNLLFSSEGYGEALVASCMQVAAQAEYANLPKGGVIVRINGVKVTQTGGGDVTVVTGAKFIRLSPHLGTTRLGNRFIDIEVEKDWSVKLTRGAHSFTFTKKCAMVCNGKMQAGFDQNNGLKVVNLQPRHPLLAEPFAGRRPISRTSARTFSSSITPKRRPWVQTYVRGGFGFL